VSSPPDARGWFVRSGTLHRLGREVEARADVRKACELGIEQACVLERRWRQ